MQLKHYKFSFWANHRLEGGEVWAVSSYEVEKAISNDFPQAYGIYVWVDYS